MESSTLRYHHAKFYTQMSSCKVLHSYIIMQSSTLRYHHAKFYTHISSIKVLHSVITMQSSTLRYHHVKFYTQMSSPQLNFATLHKTLISLNRTALSENYVVKWRPTSSFSRDYKYYDHHWVQVGLQGSHCDWKLTFKVQLLVLVMFNVGATICYRFPFCTYNPPPPLPHTRERTHARYQVKQRTGLPCSLKCLLCFRVMLTLFCCVSRSC